MLYRLRIVAGARRTMQALPRRLRQDAQEIVLDLQENPRPPDSKPLGRELIGLHRIRFDGWRIIYQIDEDDGIVTILAVKPRTADTYLDF